MWIRLSRYRIIMSVLSQTAEYALRAIVTMAQSEAISKTAHEIARVSQVPLDYLPKVLNVLARAGIVKAQRGRGGGFSLVRPAAEMTVFDVLNAVDPIRRIRSCPLHLRAHAARMCPLHRKLDDALALMEVAFRSTTISELCEPAAGQPALCGEALCGEDGYVAISR
jgi:Rrf2 family transcriptional regulator, nitric oxide-sensitive transcriptional repressor